MNAAGGGNSDKSAATSPVQVHFAREILGPRRKIVDEQAHESLIGSGEQRVVGLPLLPDRPYRPESSGPSHECAGAGSQQAPVGMWVAER